MIFFFYLFLFFVIVANLELYCFLLFGAVIGLLPTFLVIIGTGMLGAYLAKQEGLRSWHRIQNALAHGQNPSREMINGLCILLAGIALCIPGFISDLFGLLLLLPPVRLLLVAYISQHWRPGGFFGFHGYGRPHSEADDSEVGDSQSGPTVFRHAQDDSDVIDVEPLDRGEDAH